MTAAEQPVVGYHITVTALHHDQNGALQDGHVLLSAVSDKPVLAEAVGDVLHLIGGDVPEREWSVRFHGAHVDAGHFTEAAARHYASAMSAEVVYRVVGPWRTADPEPTN